jgi:hypothetical protein
LLITDKLVMDAERQVNGTDPGLRLRRVDATFLSRRAVKAVLK